MLKQLTAEAEQWCRERIAQHNDNLKGWENPGGYLIHTEPDPQERELTRTRLSAARCELIDLLVKYCGADESRLLKLSLRDPSMVLSANLISKEHRPS